MTSRRAFLIGATASLGVVAACGSGDESSSRATTTTAAGPQTTGAASPRPNVLYVTGDDLGTRLGAYGHPEMVTPRIDSFARGAALFEQCHCQVTLCGPSRVSILTGLRPETTGVLQHGDLWQEAVPDAVSLPRHFRNSGYRTYRAGKISDDRNGLLDDAWTAETVASISDVADATELLELVAAGDPDQPFFAALGFDEPHCPWTPTSGAIDGYSVRQAEAELGPGRQVNEGFLRQCAPDLRPGLVGADSDLVELTEAEAAELAHGYIASVTDLDSMFGTVLDTADELSLLDNTIVIFWSGDHGFALGDSGKWGKWLTYDSMARVPLIMQLPGRRGSGARASGLVEAVDMFPTLVGLCGLDAPAQALDGVSAEPLFDAPDQAWKEMVFTRYGNARGLTTERYHLAHDDFWGTNELYDRIEDPGEVNDIASEYPEEVSRLLELLERGPQRP